MANAHSAHSLISERISVNLAASRVLESQRTYLTFVETCKLMAKAPLDFFRRFFDMIVAGRRDYALMIEAFLVQPVKKQKTPIS